jgi:hypothetical protein
VKLADDPRLPLMFGPVIAASPNPPPSREYLEWHASMVFRG